MLTRVRLKNFKAWKEADLRLGKVTGLFGTNSAGKSSLLQFLLLLKQTRNATDRGLVLDFGGPDDLVHLGAFEDVVHRRDVDKRMRWRLYWTLPEDLKASEPGEPPLGLSLRGSKLISESEVGLRQVRGRRAVLWPYKLSYRFEGVQFGLQCRESDNKFELTSEGGSFKFQRGRGRPSALPHPIKTHLFPSEVRSQFQNTGFLGDFELAYERLMDSVYYLGPLREYPKRDYYWGGSSPQDVGPRGERTVEAMLAAERQDEKRQLARKKRKRPFNEIIGHWLKELGLAAEFDLREIGKQSNRYRTAVKTAGSSVDASLGDVGFGVSQVLPALVLLYYVPKGATVLMEQPELHLHPKVQSGLADVMLSVAAARNVQIVVESHSEHLMRRLQRRVAEGRASSEDVRLYFVSSDRGTAVLSDLTLNEFGEIENWPRHFFGDEMGEVAAISEASLARRLGSGA